MRRYFISGGTGFIGREIVRQLLKRDDTEIIVCLTRGHRTYETLLMHDKLLYKTGDITECNFPRLGITDVIHGANEVNDLLQPDQPRYYYTIVEGTNRILAWCSLHGIERTLLLSSGAVTRDTVYGRAKRQSEFLAVKYGNVKVARIYSVIGEEMPLNGQYAAGKFIHMAQNGAVQCYGGDSIRSYLHVTDCAEWLLRILDNGQPLQPYDVAGNEAVSILDLACRVAATWKVPFEVITGPKRDDMYLPDLSDSTALGCRQNISLNEALRKIHAYYVRNSDQ